MTGADVGRAAALLLAVVFVWAGGVKLVRRPATAVAFAGLGLPAPRLLGVVVPVVELGLAVVLVVAPVVGGAVALALLAFFTTVLVGALRSGATTGCGCFGSAEPHPVAPADLVRNAALAVLAGVALLLG